MPERVDRLRNAVLVNVKRVFRPASGSTARCHPAPTHSAAPHTHPSRSVYFPPSRSIFPRPTPCDPPVWRSRRRDQDPAKAQGRDPPSAKAVSQQGVACAGSRRRRRLLSLIRPPHAAAMTNHPTARHPRPHSFTAKVHSTPGDYVPSAAEAPAAARVVSSIYASSHPASPPTACTRSRTRSAAPR